MCSQKKVILFTKLYGLQPSDVLEFIDGLGNTSIGNLRTFYGLYDTTYHYYVYLMGEQIGEELKRL